MRAMASALRPWLKLGPGEEAAHERSAGSFVINVLEASPSTPHDAWIPILRSGAEDEVEAVVHALDKVADTVRTARQQGRVVYLHCGQGMERSPLAAAWTLWKLHEARPSTRHTARLSVSIRRPRTVRSGSPGRLATHSHPSRAHSR